MRPFKFGIEVPKTWKDVLMIDSDAGNRLCQDAMAKEVEALINHECFDYKSPN